MSSRASLGVLAWLGLVVFAGTGCGRVTSAKSAMPNDGHDTTPLAKCSVAASRAQPLVTEWPASYTRRASRPPARRSGGGGILGLRSEDHRSLPALRIVRVEEDHLSTDTADIQDEDDLYAKLPLGAASLSGQLTTSGSPVQIFLTPIRRSVPLNILSGSADALVHYLEQPGATATVRSHESGAAVPSLGAYGFRETDKQEQAELAVRAAPRAAAPRARIKKGDTQFASGGSPGASGSAGAPGANGAPAPGQPGRADIRVAE